MAEQKAERLTSVEDDPWAWASETPAPEPEEPAKRHTAEAALDGARRLVDEGTEAETAAQAMSSLLSQAIQHMEDTLDPGLLVEAVASIQRARSELKTVEDLASRALGRLAREMPQLSQGPCSTGSYVVRGGATRKAWDHDGWKHDVRANIVEGLELDDISQVITDDGEVIPLNLAKTIQEAITLAQSVHGSAAPKVTALKPLGLKASDYCETTPGPFTITITADADTTKEDTTHG